MGAHQRRYLRAIILCALLTEQAQGGPPLMCVATASASDFDHSFDHQMVVDATGRQLYVFGGKIVSPERSDAPAFSGLYRYAIETATWTLLLSIAMAYLD